ncbi:DUF6401 family natural product biosynthesis protein [Nonomuraea glycinis]|uniref:Uncharacterized protein n=1 Tax=Nonomuraea glycinis TaxID=2047744 RepID=A0A918ACM0_9ACTN|nr:DUF6401 family natural product biosynthesis protein [Nonomuraea glycinis]MCA2179618.1 DUF6401 family natural product biosynthesis protein [Nonomuraea glycinis]WSG67043.1 DUF6401 family natural product biosynthesis protein [Nonomuraea glycinis]GGP15299.1 hypothetical protein GCM10012278_74490 [Nonomuraea glycinis]
MNLQEGWAASPLRSVMDLLGHTQLDRMTTEPGLVSAVDQHAAELRDAIPMDRETLGDYVLGFLDELRDREWMFDGELDAPALRLTAACWLARESGFLEDGLPA